MQKTTLFPQSDFVVLFCMISFHNTFSVINGDLIWYGLNNYVLLWSDWLSCDPLRWSHDSQSPHKETLVPHLVATLIYLSQNYSYYIRGNIQPLSACFDIFTSLHWNDVLYGLVNQYGYQQTLYVDLMLVHGWYNVLEAGPTVYEHCVIASVLGGWEAWY